MREERSTLDVSGLGREFLGLRCMLEVARAFLKGEPPPPAQALAAGTTNARAEHEVLSRLAEAGLVYAVARSLDEGDGPGTGATCRPETPRSPRCARSRRRSGAAGPPPRSWTPERPAAPSEAGAGVRRGGRGCHGLSLAEAVRRAEADAEAVPRGA